uniref:Uncharacterized protein n=1 Tax=uncultured Aquificia bacterium TaxID=453415 RepID=H5SDS8_9BACT|nr:hypothetical protein HGMM_F14E04C05 [uncultured Aquificae bacterium]
MFFTGSGQTTLTLTISPAVESFMLYVEPASFGFHNCTVTTDAGDNSGPVAINGNAGARGFAFVHATPVINSITITCDAGADGFAIGEFAATCSTAGGAETPKPSISHITSPEFGTKDMLDFKNVLILTKKGPAIIRIESRSPIFISGIRINEFRTPSLGGASIRSNASAVALQAQQTQEQNFILDTSAGEKPCGSTTFNLAGYCTVGVFFEPKSEGKKEAYLEVYYNTPDPVRIYMTGTGTSQQSQPQPQPSPQPPGAGSGGSSGGSAAGAGTGGGGGGCSMVSGASPINALAWLILPGAALLRRIRRS